MGDLSNRLRIEIRGTMQGVGFRPFVFRLATQLGLAGFVKNTARGLTIEVEGPASTTQLFLRRLQEEKPPLSLIRSIQTASLDPAGFTSFQIESSADEGEISAHVLPDVALCLECLKDIQNPADRRYRYPFTNCTHCGPRYSIIEALPYDRGHTTMKSFSMCGACRTEYEDPSNRRFHAQPNACPACGPQLELRDARGDFISMGDEALLKTAETLRAGRIVAMKGLGGVHLLVDARNQDAVIRLRERKGREEKPLALMCSSLEMAKELCEVSPLEGELLSSMAAPIVLLKRKGKAKIAEAVAPMNPRLGIMLAYTPLHALLLTELNFPVVATSGNRSDEPICIDNDETVERLRAVADVFLLHNRPIVRQVDDSVVRVVAGRGLVIRRSRGYAPSPIMVGAKNPPLLAVGGHMKNTVAVTVEDAVFLSQHIGDLDSKESVIAFERTGTSLMELYGIKPVTVVSDLHPDYFSTQFARRFPAPHVQVQHHHAHIVSCMAENGLDGEVLGVAWDGTGLGTDGTIWGGEFLLSSSESFKRVGHVRPFRLPGGDKAAQEPRRAAAGLLFEMLGENEFSKSDFFKKDRFSKPERDVIKNMLAKGLHSPFTSSMGRLFDAVASLIGVRQIAHYEGQAAMELEYAQEGHSTDKAYRFDVAEGVFNWELLIRGILDDVQAATPTGLISAKFHNTLVEVLVDMAKRVGVNRVVLSGGCFQNAILTERAVARLREEGFKPFWHEVIPPNDGGLALGQAVVASRQMATRQMAGQQRKGAI